MITKPPVWTPKTPINLITLHFPQNQRAVSIWRLKSQAYRPFIWARKQNRDFHDFHSPVAYKLPDPAKSVQRNRERSNQLQVFTPLQASTSGWTIGIAVFASLLYAGYTLLPSNESETLQPQFSEVEDMSVKVPPGHLGNLTPDQE